MHDNSLHSLIYPIIKGIDFLWFRNFYFHKILKKNKRKLLKNKLNLILNEYRETNNCERFVQRTEAILAHVEMGKYL